MEFFIYIFIGSLAGFMAGLLGIGGGFIVVPSLFYLFSLSHVPSENMMQTAIGTSLAAMIFTTSSSAWAHFKHRDIDWSIFRKLALGIILGTVVGAFIAHLLPTSSLRKIFGVFAIVFGIYFIFITNHEKKEGHLVPHPMVVQFAGFFIGGISSILGIGGGIITVPIVLKFGYSLQQAISVSATTSFLIAIIGSLSFFGFGMHNHALGYIDIPAFLIIGLTAATIAPFGADLAHKISTVYLKRVFGVFLLLVGLTMI